MSLPGTAARRGARAFIRGIAPVLAAGTLAAALTGAGYFLRLIDMSVLTLGAERPFPDYRTALWREHVVEVLAAVPLGGPDAAGGRAVLEGLREGLAGANARAPAHGPRFLLRIEDSTAGDVGGESWQTFVRDERFDVIVVWRPSEMTALDRVRGYRTMLWIGCSGERKTTTFDACALADQGVEGGRAIAAVLEETARLARLLLASPPDALLAAASVRTGSHHVLVDDDRVLRFEPLPRGGARDEPSA